MIITNNNNQRPIVSKLAHKNVLDLLQLSLNCHAKKLTTVIKGPGFRGQSIIKLFNLREIGC